MGGWWFRPSVRGGDARARFGRGFAAMLPLWAAAIPVGLAYGVAAQAAGLGDGPTLLMSLVVFSATAQLSAVALLGSGAPLLVVLATTLGLNLQLVLYGLTLGRQLRPSPIGRLAAAYFLTDGAYGVASATGNLSVAGLVGTGVSMFVAWNLGTALAVAAGPILGNLGPLGVSLVTPLTFLALLVPLVRTRAAALTVLAAGTATLLLSPVAVGGLAVLGAAVTGSAAGAWWAERSGRPGAAGVVDPAEGPA
jgi:predicted branched-subunit amino acid permease